jgi:hypothetical protein
LQRQKQAKVAVVGTALDGLKVPAMDEVAYRHMWEESLTRILKAEESMKKKGQRGERIRHCVLARLLAGKPLDESMCR